MIEVAPAAASSVVVAGMETISYFVIAEPPLLAGAVQRTVADALPAVALPIVGAPGAVAGAPCGVTLFERADALLSPTEFCARTVNWYGVPFVRPVMSAFVGVGPPNQTGLVVPVPL